MADLFQEFGIEYNKDDLFNGEPPKSVDVNKTAFNTVVDIDTYRKNKEIFESHLESLREKQKTEAEQAEKKTSFAIEAGAFENPNFVGGESLALGFGAIEGINKQQQEIAQEIDSLEKYKNVILNTMTSERINELKDMGAIGVGESFYRALDKKNLPFVGGFVESYRTSKATEILEKFRNGEKLTPEEDKYITDFTQNMFEESIRGYSLGGRIVEGASILPAYLLEFWAAKGASGKTLSYLSKSTKVGGAISSGVSALEKTGKAGRAVAKTARALTEAGTRALYLPTIYTKNYNDMRLNSVFSIGENGQILLSENPEAKATTLLKAFGLATITSLSEESGETLTAIAKKGLSPIYAKLPEKVRVGLVNLARQTDKFKNATISQMFSKAGYSNMLAEIGEERLEDFLGALTGLQPTKESYFDSIGHAIMPGWDEFCVEIGVLSIPGAIRSGTSYLMNKGYSREFVDGLSTTEQDNLVDLEVGKEIGEQKEVPVPVDERIEEAKERISFLEKEKETPSAEYEEGELDSEIEEAKTELSSLENKKNRQYEVIQKTNPMQDEIHTGIRSADDIKSFDEAIQDEESFTWGDYSKEDAERDLKKGSVTVYSSHPIQNGTFVSTSKRQAQDYAGGGEIFEKEVPIGDVAWINGDEGQYAQVTTDESRQEMKVRGLSLNTAQRAIQQNIKINEEDLPEYQKRDSADVAKRADDFVRENKELAIKIVKGQAPEQAGLFRQDLYTALQIVAMEDGDSELLNDLMRSFTTGEATELGQRIQALARISAEYSPVKAMMDIREERMKERGVSKKKLKSEVEKESKKIKESISKSVKLSAWESFLKELEC